MEDKLEVRVSKNSVLRPIEFVGTEFNEWNEKKKTLYTMTVKEAKKLKNDLQNSLNEHYSNEARKERETKKVVDITKFFK